VNGDQLVEQMSLADLGADELVQMMISDTNRNVEVDLELAIRRARQAVKLLGRAGTPNGVADVTLRAEAYESLAKALMVQYGRAKLPDIEALAELIQLFKKTERKESERLFKKIRDYHQKEEPKRYPLLWEIAGMLRAGGDQAWIRAGLKRDFTAWLNAFSVVERDVEHAFDASKHIEGYLQFLNRNQALDPEKSGKLNILRSNVVRTLLGSSQFEQALLLTDQLSPPEPLLRAQCLEGLGRHAEAIQLYEQAGDLSAACKAARKIPDIDQAMRLMKASRMNGAELDALSWLKSLNELVATKPNNVNMLLTAEENHFMQSLVKVCRQDAPQSENQSLSKKTKSAAIKSKAHFKMN
jgi:tetratricopeptide (TPR) repeat protein